MVYILHIDTSGDTGMIMLACDGMPVATRINETARDHAGSINNMVDAVLNEAGMDLAGLDAIAVCSGPGSYTGLRIGMATAKGICYTLDKPLLLNSRLELMADPGPEETVLSIIPARAGEYFIGVYTHEKVVVPPRHITTEELNNFLDDHSVTRVNGNIQNDVHIENGIYINSSDEISAHVWAAKTLHALSEGNIENVATAMPLYLKEVFIHKKL